MKRTIVDASQLELEDNVVTIKRVTKVVKGGRNMRFTALVVVGDKNGHVGAGLGKAAEIPEAIRKGKEDAIKSMIELPMDENGSVPHDFIGKFGSAEVLLKKSPEGTGIIAGGPARSVLELAGFKNIPVDELRERIDEIEQGKPVYVICQSGLRSYISCRILAGYGFDAYNFAGGFRFYDAVNNDRALIERALPCGMDK